MAWEIDASGIEELQQKMENAGTKAGTTIQTYLAKEGYERVANHIPGLIHASGRNWRGKATSAASAGPTTVFMQETSGLTLTVKSKSRYGYLYFPDDGSNTVRHAGNQQFMLRGGEAALQDGMIDEMAQRLVEVIEEG